MAYDRRVGRVRCFPHHIHRLAFQICNPMNPQERQQLQELYDWMLSKQKQQITLPLDTDSQGVVYENVPIFKRSAVGSPTPAGTLLVEINGREYLIITA